MVNKRRDAVILDLILTVDADLLLDLELDRKTVGIRSEVNPPRDGRL